MNRARLLALAQLTRIPNVFTAFADIAMAGCATSAILVQPLPWFVLLLASASLYLAGMVLNDFFDRTEDEQARPFRPIPSGRISARFALLLGIVLMLTGLGLAEGARMLAPGTGLANPLLVAGILTIAIVAYDAGLKHTLIGPVAMGACRFLNVLLGLSLLTDFSFELRMHMAAVVGVYIVGVTWFARTEEGQSQKGHLRAASVVMLAALLLALAIPSHFPAGTSPMVYPYLVVAFGFFIGERLVAAIRHPGPKEVQMAVKRSILGLILLDAVLATAFVGWSGLAIVALLLPARWLGKWVYST